MSVKLISWVFDYSQSSGSDRLVMLALADRADEDGFCWPGISFLAKKARVSERTAQRSLATLVQLGELLITPGGGRHETNRYQILIEKGCQYVTPEKGDTAVTGDTQGEERVTPPAEKGDTAVTRSVSDSSLDPSLSARTVENQPTDIVHWIESECTRLQIRPGFQSSNTKAKTALREADSPALRMEIGTVLTSMAYHNRNITALVTGLVPSQRSKSQSRAFYPARPPDRQPYDPPPRFAKPVKESHASKIQRAFSAIDYSKGGTSGAK